MKPARIIPIAVVLLIAAGAIWWLRRPDSPNGFTASGTVEATDADLGFRVGGRLEAVLPREGDEVARGDTIAALESDEASAALEAAVAAAEVARARLSEVEAGPRSEERAQLDAALRIAEQRDVDARRELARAESLHEGGAISLRQLEAAQTAASVAEDALAQAREASRMATRGSRTEQIQAARAALQQAEAQVERARA
ncbi:MAG: biotin/lipoyl-binding protein, partial [Gemmatimonadota bacterium]